MFTVHERTIEGIQPQQQYPTFEEALLEAADFVQDPGSWRVHVTNPDGVIVADLLGKAAVPECQNLACPPQSPRLSQDRRPLVS